MLVTRRIMAVRVNTFEDGYTCNVPLPPEVLSEKQVDVISILKKYKDTIKY